MRSKLVKYTVAVGAGAGIMFGGMQIAQAVNTNEWVKFDKVDSTHATNGITRLRINGDGCLKTEDAATLVLDNYDPANGDVIYHCVQP